MKNTRLIIVFCCLLSDGILTENAFNCHLPDGCRLEKGYLQENFDENEIGKQLNNMITCDINNAMNSRLDSKIHRFLSVIKIVKSLIIITAKLFSDGPLKN